MLGPTPFRDILLVAGYELRETLRTRRALILIVLYLVGGFAFARWFVSMIGSFEESAAKALGTHAASTPGALTRQLLQDPTYNQMIRGFFHNDAVADYLLGLPPIALVYAWSSLQFIPFLIMITSADTVAQETQSRGVRFIALRTGRLEFVAGKMLGQAALMALVTLLTGFVYLGVAAEGLQGFELFPTLSAILQFWPRIAVYGLSFVGLCFLFTTNAGSANTARALALIALFGTAMMDGAAAVFMRRQAGDMWELLRFLLPFIHKDELWSPQLTTLGSTSLILVALSALYLGGALVLYRRRDL